MEYVPTPSASSSAMVFDTVEGPPPPSSFWPTKIIYAPIAVLNDGACRQEMLVVDGVHRSVHFYRALLPNDVFAWDGITWYSSAADSSVWLRLDLTLHFCHANEHVRSRGLSKKMDPSLDSSVEDCMHHMQEAQAMVRENGDVLLRGSIVCDPQGGRDWYICPVYCCIV